MKTKRTTDLFRFVTLRAPQLISENKKSLGFIEHPKPEASHFLKSFSADSTWEEKQSKLKAASSSFTPYTKVEQVKALSAECWSFSLWLGENKNNLDREQIEKNVPGSLLTVEQMLKVWDNVFYDLLNKKNPYIRQACLQLIVAMNFAENYKIYSPDNPIPKGKEEEQLSALKRLANGKVIIDNAFSAETSSESTGNGYTQFAATRQCPVHQAKLAELRTPVLREMKEELLSLSKRYTRDYQTTFESKKAVYETEVNKIVDGYLSKKPQLADKVQNVEKTKVTRQDLTKENLELTEKSNVTEAVDVEYELPYDLVDDFTFSFDSPLSEKYTKGKISKTTTAFIQQRELQDATIDEALAQIDKELDENVKQTSLAKRKRYKEVLINGVQTRKSEQTPNDFGISFHYTPVSGEVTESTRPEMYFTMNTGYNGAFLAEEKFALTVDGKNQKLTDVKVLSSTDRNILVKLDSAEGLTLPEYKTFEFQASFKLDNGAEYQIAKKGYTNLAECHTGIAIPISGTVTGVEHYGVNRIGVADFRRVEQELCCYVAGEVSHIENILAREYKEKSTRHLTSSETTTELFTERELEESNDTTSSTRFEMSSEIAEVIEKDRNTNLGFSTGASGEYYGIQFSADAYGDFSFGQSTSESNSQARTYAEDVTRRALERIVQRTSLTRTSRILREFEENNRHGYDNREGTEHVTGVFRWIDKVYRNRIVNYHKRLIYEFMIPEPARFYKEAIIVKAEEEEVGTTGGGGTGSTNVAVKPDNPSVHGISSANDITRANYQQIASIYSVSPDAPQDEFVTLSKSYAQNIGGTDKEKSFSYPSEMNVPNGYEGCNLNFVASYKYTARTGAKAYMRVSAAGQSWTSPEYRGSGSDSKTINRTISGITGAVSVSVVTKKMREFSLTVNVKCCLKQSVLNTWKQDVYQQIMDAYNDQLEAYNDAQNTGEGETGVPGSSENEDQRLNLNPKFNAKVVMTELKRLCIEMITRPYGIQQGRDLLDKGVCEVPEIKLGPMLDIYGSQVKFFEQAFDWNLMAQMFYPYYWAKRCDWKELFQSQVSDDHIFQAFLQSGMGRVVVPVRPGFEDAVTHYMATGEIWNGIGLALDSDDELYLSIMDEMMQIEGAVEGEEWETVVPSSLTIVQARSALLNDEGLPCCETDEEVLGLLNIEPSTNILELQKNLPNG